MGGKYSKKKQHFFLKSSSFLFFGKKPANIYFSCPTFEICGETFRKVATVQRRLSETATRLFSLKVIFNNIKCDAKSRYSSSQFSSRSSSLVRYRHKNLFLEFDSGFAVPLLDLLFRYSTSHSGYLICYRHHFLAF
jgi:hypothetical protein